MGARHCAQEAVPVDLDESMAEGAVVFFNHDATGNTQVAIKPSVPLRTVSLVTSFFSYIFSEHPVMQVDLPDTAAIKLDTHLKIAALGFLGDGLHLQRENQ